MIRIGLFSLLIACSCSVTNSYNIIPLPLEMIQQEGKFTISAKTTVVVPEIGDDFSLSADFFIQRFKAASGITLCMVHDTGNAPANSVIFKKSENSELGNEGYMLSVSKTGAIIEAMTGNGAFYAIQSLMQLLPPEIYSPKKQRLSWCVPCVEIKDKPRYSYRGLHLDVARHFFPVEFVKRYIDMIAFHKMNTFHWHLTEDQGWRIEIKSHPKLTEIGSIRKETLIGSYYDLYPQEFDGTPHGGYYTQEEVREVVEYARQRFVTVIPEIEMPGHAMAALTAYPELSCTGGPFEVATKWGIFPDVFCPKEETFIMLEDVLKEVMELFPGEYIHIGGDECPKVRWKVCPHCQALMKREKLKNEDELQSYFMSRIEKFVSAHGRRIIGWDEILEGGLPERATVMSWRGVSGGIAAAQQRHHVIMSPITHCYLNLYQYDPYLEPLTFGDYLTLQKCYSYEPTPAELSAEEQKYILGVQGNMWCEYASTEEDVEYMVFPRAAAIAEIGWTDGAKKDYGRFAARLKAHLKRFDFYGWGYSKTMFDVLATPKTQFDEGKLYLNLQSQYDSTAIRYTLDGSVPTAKSMKYTEPVEIKGRRILKAGIFENGKLMGRIFEREYVGHKAIGAVCTLANGVTTAIPVDGLRAFVFENPGWYVRPRNAIRADGQDITLTIDLKEVQLITRITACFVNQPLYRVVAPTHITVAYSTDGENYTVLPMVSIENKEPNRRRNVEGSIDTGNITARYLSVTITNAGSPFPAGSTNEGKPSVILLDELIVE